jgi:hypothetical protein
MSPPLCGALPRQLLVRWLPTRTHEPAGPLCLRAKLLPPPWLQRLAASKGVGPSTLPPSRESMSRLAVPSPLRSDRRGEVENFPAAFSAPLRRGTEVSVVSSKGSPRADRNNEGASVVLSLTPLQAQLLILVITSMQPQNPWLDDVRDQLQLTAPDLASRGSSPAASVLAAAKAIINEAQTNVAAEREAKEVAATAATTEQSVEAAAVMTAQAASHARDRKADATASAAHELAETAAHAATGIQIRADALALEVATAAVQAAETVSASIAAGGDAEAAVIALRLAATVDAAALATVDETALAATAVATAVAAAAAHAALAAAAAAAVFEREVADAASAVRAIATNTARDLAVDTDAKAVEVALAARRSNRL